MASPASARFAPRAAWAGFLREGTHGASVSSPGVTLAPREGLALATIVARRGRIEALQRAMTALAGATLPGKPAYSRGRDAEGDEIGQRIEFLAELGHALGQLRDRSVEGVEHECDEDVERGPLVLVLHGLHDAGHTEVQPEGGHAAREHVNGMARPPAFATAIPSEFFHGHIHRNRAIIVDPPFTF